MRRVRSFPSLGDYRRRPAGSVASLVGPGSAHLPSRCCVTLFFKFSRIWSVRNLDLLLLFALVARDDAARRATGTTSPGSPSSGSSWARRSGWSAACSTWACRAAAARAEPERGGAGSACRSGCSACSWPRRSACPSRKGPPGTRPTRGPRGPGRAGRRGGRGEAPAVKQVIKIAPLPPR